MIILTYFYFSDIFNAGLLLVTEYFYSVVVVLVLKYRLGILPPPLLKGVNEFRRSAERSCALRGLQLTLGGAGLKASSRPAGVMN